ncbi:MAG: hypothetical protein HWN68_02215 [Desulfobacterales bacterium]|nr:hypothetical protein [Desulfobacterales bacterium]
MSRRTEVVNANPNKKPWQFQKGLKNPQYKHGGYVRQPMNEKEQEWLEKKKLEYIEFYPQLSEPAMLDLLEDMLNTRLRMKRVEEFIDDPAVTKGKAAAFDRLTQLTRTCMLLMSRMGISYTSQRYVKKKKFKTAEELAEEFTRP